MIIPSYYPQLLSQRGRVSCRRLSQSDRHSSHSACLTPRPLGSTGITLLQRYYESVRLPRTATDLVIDSQLSLSALTRHHDGSPRFLTNLSSRASFNHPGWSSEYKIPLKSSPVTGFTISGRLATNKLCNEAESSSPIRNEARNFVVREELPLFALSKKKNRKKIPICLPDRVTPHRQTATTCRTDN